jgi:hypothetical protein
MLLKAGNIPNFLWEYSNIFYKKLCFFLIYIFYISPPPPEGERRGLRDWGGERTAAATLANQNNQHI